VTERLEHQALSLPLWSGMSEEMITYVIDAIVSSARQR
jgi:dTDP-4-amino-4,6-dideoxygalactose transaminase